MWEKGHLIEKGLNQILEIKQGMKTGRDFEA